MSPLAALGRNDKKGVLRSVLSDLLVPTLLRGNAPWDAPASRMQRGSVAALRSHGGPWERARMRKT